MAVKIVFKPFFMAIQICQKLGFSFITHMSLEKKTVF